MAQNQEAGRPATESWREAQAVLIVTPVDPALPINFTRALAKRRKHRALEVARERAETLGYANDHEGCTVWLRVADVAARLLLDAPEPECSAPMLYRR